MVPKHNSFSSKRAGEVEIGLGEDIFVYVVVCSLSKDSKWTSWFRKTAELVDEYFDVTVL